jgi:hypothetical protein
MPDGRALGHVFTRWVAASTVPLGRDEWPSLAEKPDDQIVDLAA